MQYYKPPWEADPISYLVNARFPGVEKLRRARRAGAYGPPNTGSKAVEQAFDAYRAELKKLSPNEVAIRVQEVQLAEAKALAAKEEAEEAARFFNQAGTNADYKYWAKMAYWTIDEAVALSFGKNPKIVNWDGIRPYIAASAFATRYAAKREIALRAETMRQIWASTVPATFLAWAERIGFSVPQELVEAIRAQGVQIADWKKLYDQQVELTAKAKQDARSAHQQFLDEIERHRQFLTRMRGEHQEICEGYKRRIIELENAPRPPAEKPLSVRERESLLKLVIGMAIKGYIYDPGAARTGTPREIAGDLEEVGLSLDDDTIRKYLNEAKDLLPQTAAG